MLNAVLAKLQRESAARGWAMRADDTWRAFQLAPEGPDTHRARETRDAALDVLDGLPAFRLRDAATGRPIAMIAYALPRPAEPDPDVAYAPAVLERAKESGLEAALADTFDILGYQAVVIAPPGTTLPTEIEAKEEAADDA